MSRRKRPLHLSEAQRLELERARARHPKAYMRERAAALLAIASGKATYAVATGGLLKPRHPDTLYAWLNTYEKKGFAALEHAPRRRGAFPPRARAATARGLTAGSTRAPRSLGSPQPLVSGSDPKQL